MKRMIPVLQQQHKDVLLEMRRLRVILQKASSPERADKLKVRLSSLAELLTLHLAQEDFHLYPKLLHSSDKRLKAFVSVLKSESGALAEGFDLYVKRWVFGDAILRDGAGFEKETESVLGALHKRIKQEERELFPLVVSSDSEAA